VLVLVVLNLLHVVIYYFFRKREELPSLVIWPGLELTLTTMALVGWTTACTSVIARKKP
jgi:hypothetical protein